MINGLKIGLALGSGGSRGLAHAGVLDALEEAGIRADCVAGTSMGAIIGALYAQNPDPAWVWERVNLYVNDETCASTWAAYVPRETDSEEEQRQSRLASIFDFMQRKMIAVKTVTRPWLQDAEHLRGPLTRIVTAESFADLQIPFAAVALDLISGEPVIYDEGPLIDALYASSAIPAIFPPVERDGMVICDGGGPFRVPVEACRAMGADFVIAVDIAAFEDTKFATGLDLILRSNTIARQRLNEFVCRQADLVLSPDVSEFHWANFQVADACRARGYTATRSALPELRRLIRTRRSLGYRLRRAMARRCGCDVSAGPGP
jgi:NTE family protein